MKVEWPSSRTASPQHSSASPTLRLPRRFAGVAWTAWLLSVALLWGQHRIGVLHPSALLFLLLLSVAVFAALCGLFCALWRVVRGPKRWAGAALGLACLLQVALWAALAAYILYLTTSGNTPKTSSRNTASMGVASLMELEAACIYHQMESDRLVMFYDNRVTDPRRDLEAMDRHVARLEKITGRPLRAKIHWVRGELLGQRHMAILGIGSASSPADWETADNPDGLSVDRHELAHGVIHEMQPPEADAPTLLIEGWAEAQSGTTYCRRAEWARQSRDLWRRRTGAGPTESYLRELTGPVWYHRIDGPVYSVGGALAEFLIRKYGSERFLRLYFACRPGRFDAECLAQLGTDLDSLESEFWAEVKHSAGNPAPAKWSISRPSGIPGRKTSSCKDRRVRAETWAAHDAAMPPERRRSSPSRDAVRRRHDHPRPRP